MWSEYYNNIIIVYGNFARFRVIIGPPRAWMIPTVKIGLLPCISNFPRVYAETTYYYSYSYIPVPSFVKNHTDIYVSPSYVYNIIIVNRSWSFIYFKTRDCNVSILYFNHVLLTAVGCRVHWSFSHYNTIKGDFLYEYNRLKAEYFFCFQVEMNYQRKRHVGFEVGHT